MRDTAESCRLVQDNSGAFGEVHSASSVLKASRHNGCDRYIAKTFKPIKVPVARPVRKQSGTAECVSVPVLSRAFFILPERREVNEASIVKWM